MKKENVPVRVENRGIVIDSMESLWRFAKMIHSAGRVPKSFQTIEQIAVAIAYGLEIGLSPLQSIHTISVINNKPSLSTEGILALAKARGLVEYCRETFKGSGEKLAAICEVKRRGETYPVISEFGVEDAKRAGLWGRSGPWKQYPKIMLKNRARGFALRDAFPDVVRGLISSEEALDYPQPAQVTPVDPGEYEATEPEFTHVAQIMPDARLNEPVTMNESNESKTLFKVMNQGGI